VLACHKFHEAPKPRGQDGGGDSSLASDSETASFGFEFAGFTLIELLVVIAVIAILAAMLIPALSRSKAQAQSIVCKNHLHEMTLALRMYTDDYKAYPYYSDGGYGGPGVGPWYVALQPYYRLKWSNPAFHCPAYAGVVTTDVSDNWGSYSYNVAGAVHEPNVSVTTPSFGVGQWYGNSETNIPARAENQVIAPSGTFAFADTTLQGENENVAHSTMTYFQMGTGWSGQDWTGCFVLGGQAIAAGASGMFQHGKLMNVASCDAHVDSIRPMDLFNPAVSAQNWNYDHQAHEDLWPEP
jgi:prepilin-type N-terminal cleavage/methylation domain-containing protein